MSETNSMYKTRECGHCIHLFDCPGKPSKEINCLKYKEREWQQKDLCSAKNLQKH